MKKGIVKKLIYGLTACSIGFSSFAIYKGFIANKDLLKNQSYQTEVLKQLDADMIIMQDFSYIKDGDLKKLVRLKPNKEKEICVEISSEITDKTKNNIEKSLTEFNEIFTNINDSYNFKIYETTELKEFNKKSTISFKYKTLDKNTYGLTTAEKSKNFFFSNVDALENCYIKKATIYFDEKVFDSLSNSSQLYVIKHELLHSLGFSDLYDYYDDETSLMNVGIVGYSNVLSPNDLKMLYVAYGNKHINNDGSFNQENLDKVKFYINEYEKNYYEHLIDIIKEKTDVELENINKEEILNLSLEYQKSKIQIENDKFNYSLDNYSKEGNLICGKDYVILPDIKVKSKFKNNCLYNDFLVLFKIDGKLKCYNIDFYHFDSDKQIDDLAKDLDIRIN